MPLKKFMFRAICSWIDILWNKWT